MEKEKLTFFCDKIELPDEYRKAAFPLIDIIEKSYSEEYKSINSNRLVPEGYENLADKLHERLDLVTLALCIMMGIDSRERYSKIGADDEVYYASMREITIWSKKNRLEYGRIGIFGYEWLNNFFDPHVFRLGRLDFEHYSFWNGVDCTVNGIKLSGGDKCINVHIPEDGKLAQDDVIASFVKAYNFFGLSGNYPFICHSWLLYPGNREFLPENSNIVSFMNNFHIVKSEEFKEPVDLWRVYGFRDTYNLDELPKDTFLQKALVDYLKSHDGIYGRGFGVLIHNGEKII